MSSTSYLDALPYVDKQVEDPVTKAAAQALVEAELRHTPQIAEDDHRLAMSVDVFPLLKHLEELLADYPNKPIRGIDPSKYQPPVVEANATLEELEAAEKQGRIGEGYMGLRLENTSILSSYGPNAWLVRNYQLNSQLTELQATLAALKEHVTDINRTRRIFQEETGHHLKRLEGRWQNLVGSAVQLELACTAMEGEVKGLEAKKINLQGEITELEAKY
ncbi:pre-mRNA-splicing factor SPF27 [Cryptococcus deuterogattii 99/473]|uniref:Pre-mRNA-splicing factor SPF27 n=1 Tax=Cryptococcus deuterogattii Ram5 TaxID=1296110 RepID=A0A0D0T3Y9_9TREE|nr:pre-mRNA-splicing factor SPF27 [Cryptococcus deuterogattii Ram5]KIY58738.1 pre-mRNA-splicing factor SPF27 [Cryptococcus deuterogattii 99/473]